MPRYIDADALIKKIFPIGTGDGKYVINAGAVKLAIDNAPTVDVVPKSEYDAVVSAIDNSTNEFLKLHDAYQEQKVDIETLKDNNEHLAVMLMEAKQANAREIFAEIEKAFIKYYDECVTYGSPTLPYHTRQAAGFALNEMFTKIAELKKKYTEEVT